MWSNKEADFFPWNQQKFHFPWNEPIVVIIASYETGQEDSGCVGDK